MSSATRSLIRFRTLGVLAIGCLAVSFAAGGLHADKPSKAAPTRPAAAFDSSSPIIFDGWRRTANGWEQLPFEDARPSINDWIANQKKEEANNPLTRPLQQLGRIHPIRIAAAEVAVACLIALVASGGRNWGSETTQQTTLDAVR